MHSNSDIVNTVDFLHNSPRRHHLAQARIVRVASVLSGVFSPRRGIFRLSEELFSPRREYFRSGENRPCSLDYFRPSDKFSLRRGVFSSGRNWSRPSQKKLIKLFVSECLALLECNVCI